MVKEGKSEAYAELHTNLAKLQDATQEFARHLDTVQSVCEASSTLAGGAIGKPFTATFGAE